MANSFPLQDLHLPEDRTPLLRRTSNLPGLPDGRPLLNLKPPLASLGATLLSHSSSTLTSAYYTARPWCPTSAPYSSNVGASEAPGPR